MSISEQTRKVLWTRAHDRCAFPGCHQALTVDMVDATTGDSFVKPVGEQAHIRSRRADGPRHDPSYPTAKLDDYENLILLCPTHHTMIDANGGAGYSVEQLEKLRRQHEKQQGRRAQLDQTVQAYLADQYGADDTVLFQQVDLRGPSVDSMFVDVPFGCHPGAPVGALMSRIAAEHPGDREAAEDADGYIVTGAAQALLHPDWSSSGLLVGGPGQGKSTLLQYVCQFHRARRLGRRTYTGSAQDLSPVTSVARVAVRLDLRKYAQWASSNTRPDRSASSKQRKAKPSEGAWPSIEEYIAADIAQGSGGGTFRVKDLVVLVAADAVLIALDGLDEVANLKHREKVSNEIIATHRRLMANASDLVMLVATRPGPTSSSLTSAPEFPTLHLGRLSQGLRLQYLRQWAVVSGLSREAEAKLQTTFLDNQHVPHIRELASYPMQLAILLHLLHRRQLFPQQRTELYREYLKTFLDREQTEDKEPLLAQDRKVIEDIHAYLGWLLQARAEEGTSSGAIDREELRQVLRTRLEGREDGQKLAERLFSAVTTRVLCLIERDPGTFQFEVQSLREYFAALFIFDNAPTRGTGNSRDDCLDALLERPYWANVCRFFVGMFSSVEVRGIRQNLEQADRRVQGHPMVRSLGALFLDDRTYEGQASGPIQEVVDFVLAGPGVVLAEDGLLDGAGAALVLGERAGRAQAVRHLEDRLVGEGSPAVREAITSSLRRHATADDDLASWWWGRFEPTMAWLETGVGLDVLRSLDGTRNGKLVELLTSVRSDTTWHSELLAQARYDRSSDAVVKVIVDELNDGAIDTLAASASDTPVGVLIEAAAVAGLRPALAPRRATNRPADGRRRRVRRRNGLFDEIVAATGRLRTRQGPSATSHDWQRRIELVAQVWGDGWVLRQALAAVPTTVGLDGVATLLATKNADLSEAVALEAQARAHRADTGWWRQRLRQCSTDFDRRVWLAMLFTRTHVSVVTGLAAEINDVVGALTPKHFTALRHGLDESGRWGLGELHLQDPLRLGQVVFSPRALWLLRPVVTDASAEQIDKQLANGLGPVLGLGVGDLRDLMRAVGRRKSVPVESLRGTRRVLPSGTWTNEIRLGAMPRKLVSEILAAPGEWPSDVVQRAPQSAAMRLSSTAKPLSQVADEHHWFQVADHP